MRRRSRGLLALLVLGLLGGTAWGQNMDYEVPPQVGTWLPGPLGHPRYESGGFFVAAEFLYFSQTNPMSHNNQVLATRGFLDTNGSITGHINSFVGSGADALNSNQVGGPVSWQPGVNLVGGWRFENGWVLQFSWFTLIEAQYTASASLLPPGLNPGNNLADTFLFSPVFNFPPDFAGAPQNVNGGTPGGTFGIWNAATQEAIRFLQRFTQYDVALRIPVYQTSTYRNYALVGPRIVHLWEGFKWSTFSATVEGVEAQNTSAFYSNILSQNLYGFHIGGGHDWWLGQTPIGGFSVSLDLEAALFYNFNHERARYELADRSVAYTHNRNTGNLVPEVQGNLSLWYYPLEAVQIRLGYNVMAFFNTYASPQPVDFNFSSITPAYESGFTRLLQGLNIGFGVVF